MRDYISIDMHRHGFVSIYAPQIFTVGIPIAPNVYIWYESAVMKYSIAMLKKRCYEAGIN